MGSISRGGMTVLLKNLCQLPRGRTEAASVRSEPDKLSGPARVGAELRAGRERLGWTIAEIAAHLRVRPGYLAALEAGRVDELPASAYALGYLRAYASALGLDPVEQIRRFKAVESDIQTKPELDFPVPLAGRHMPAGAVMLLSLVLATGAYVGWYRLSGEGRLPAEIVPLVPERLASLAEQALPPSPRLIRTPGPMVPVLAEAPVTVTAPEPPLALPSVSPSSAAAAVPPPVPLVPSAPDTSATAPSPDGRRIVLRAQADSWLQVREPGGPILFSRVLKAGETWPVPPRSDLVLTTGNAGGTELLVDGVLAPGLGASGAVRRDVKLDPDLLKRGQFQSAQLQPTKPSPSRDTASQ